MHNKDTNLTKQIRIAIAMSSLIVVYCVGCCLRDVACLLALLAVDVDAKGRFDVAVVLFCFVVVDRRVRTDI